MAAEDGMTVNHISVLNGKVTIRTAVPQDAASLRKLRLEALHMHPEAFAADVDMTAAESNETWARRLSDYAASQSGAICIAAGGDALVGMSGIGRGHWPKAHHFGTLWGVYVKEAWRGSQVGSALVKCCLKWMVDHGIKVVSLGVNVANTAAIRCYQSCGFTVYGEEPRALYVDGVYHNELLMVKLF